MNEQVFKTANELTFKTVQDDSARLQKLLAEGNTSHLSLDLHDVSYCDSAGLALLIESKRLCKQYNVTLAMKGVPKSIASLAKFCGVEKMLEPVE